MDLQKLDKDLVKNLKMFTAGIETLLCLPYMWGFLNLNLVWFPLFIIFVLHIVTLVLSIKTWSPKNGSIAGVFINIIWWMPLIWFFWRTMHLIAAVLLWIDFSQMNNESEKWKENEFETKAEDKTEENKK